LGGALFELLELLGAGFFAHDGVVERLEDALAHGGAVLFREIFSGLTLQRLENPREQKLEPKQAVGRALFASGINIKKTIFDTPTTRALTHSHYR
jgi:hypothetical protein